MNNKLPKEEFSTEYTPEIQDSPELFNSEEILRQRMSIVETDGEYERKYTQKYRADRHEGSYNVTDHFSAKRIEIKIDGLNRELRQYYHKDKKQYKPYNETPNRNGFNHGSDYDHYFSNYGYGKGHTHSLDSAPAYANEYIENSIVALNPFQRNKLFNGHFEIGSRDPRNEQPMFLGFADTKELVFIDSEQYSSFRRLDGELSNETAIFSDSLADETVESLTQKINRLNSVLPKLLSRSNQDITQKHILILESAKNFIEQESRFVELAKSDSSFLNAYFGKATIESPITFTDTNVNSQEAMPLFIAFMQGRSRLRLDLHDHNADIITPTGEWVRQYGATFLENFQDNGIATYSTRPLMIPYWVWGDKQCHADLTTWAEHNHLSIHTTPEYNRVIICPTISQNMPTYKVEYMGRYKDAGLQYTYLGEQQVEINDPEVFSKITTKLKQVEAEEKRRSTARLAEGMAEEMAEKKAEFSAYFAEHLLTPDGSLGLAKDSAWVSTDGKGNERFDDNFDNFVYAIGEYYTTCWGKFRYASIGLGDYNDHHLVLDTNKITIREKGGRKIVTLRGVPENLKGLLIGKKGSNINRLAQKIGVDFIRVL